MKEVAASSPAPCATRTAAPPTRSGRGVDGARRRPHPAYPAPAAPGPRPRRCASTCSSCCVAAAVTYLLTPLARRFAVRVGAMAEPRDRDVHAMPTPRLGGLAMYAGVAAALPRRALTLPALHGVRALRRAGGRSSPAA